MDHCFKVRFRRIISHHRECHFVFALRSSFVSRLHFLSRRFRVKRLPRLFRDRLVEVLNTCRVAPRARIDAGITRKQRSSSFCLTLAGEV